MAVADRKVKYDGKLGDLAVRSGFGLNKNDCTFEVYLGCVKIGNNPVSVSLSRHPATEEVTLSLFGLNEYDLDAVLENFSISTGTQYETGVSA